MARMREEEESLNRARLGWHEEREPRRIIGSLSHVMGQGTLRRILGKYSTACGMEYGHGRAWHGTAPSRPQHRPRRNRTRKSSASPSLGLVGKAPSTLDPGHASQVQPCNASGGPSCAEGGVGEGRGRESTRMEMEQGSGACKTRCLWAVRCSGMQRPIKHMKHRPTAALPSQAWSKLRTKKPRRDGWRVSGGTKCRSRGRRFRVGRNRNRKQGCVCCERMDDGETIDDLPQ